MIKRLLFKALAANSGTATGKIRIIKDQEDSLLFQTGEILVTKMTDPSMVIMMAKALAIITDTGGITCHAAITSREMGVPCVVAAKTATQDLKTGQTVMVDGGKGEIYLIE